MNKIEVVKEYYMEDGIGAQLWRKIYAMSYAKYNNLLFQDTPIKNIFIHESDNINNENEKQELIKDITKLIKNPWNNIDFSDENKFYISDKVGAGLPNSQGMIEGSSNFLTMGSSFNAIEDLNNEIVIHIRRGNVVQENSRWINENTYINILKSIPAIIDKFELDTNKVSIVTDAPDIIKTYRPIDEHQLSLWNQQYLHPNEDGEFPLTSLNFDLLRSAYADLQIYNNLSTYDSFRKMLGAKLLIVGKSAFSQSAGLLSKNKVIGMYGAVNNFNGLCGIINQDGFVDY